MISPRAPLPYLVVAVVAIVPMSMAVAMGGSGVDGAAVVPTVALDSARQEILVGRHWHATRILRAEGVHTSDDPELRLLLARAEAGWRNWPEVAHLLHDQAWLSGDPSGEGWLLLGRAWEEEGRWDEARGAYRAFLDAEGHAAVDGAWVRARLARAAVAVGDVSGALETLDAFPPGLESLRGWAALEAAEARAAEGDTAAVRRLLSRVTEPRALDAGWSVVARGRLAAGDTLAALASYLAARDGASEGRRAEASTEAGRLALARGDSTAARPLLLDGFGAGTLRNRSRAAAALLALPEGDADLLLGMADVLDRMGDADSALRAFDRAARVAGGSASLPEGARLARARRMSTVRARHGEALEEFRAIRASTPDPGIGAQNLEIWAGLRRRQGRTTEVSTLRRWLLDEYPASPQAAEVLWERGFAAEGRGEVAAALETYALLASRTPEHTRAGQARMRVGQIQLSRGRVEESAQVYEAYLADFPSGRRWDEAAFWAARSRLELGDTVAARSLVERVLREEPVSYYAVVGTDLMGVPYRVDFPEGSAPETPTWLAQGLVRLDLLEKAGLEAGAAAEESLLVARARGNPVVLLTLAEALIERDRTVTGINLAWDLRRDGMAWDRRLVKVAYPFPHRDMVVREAREWGLDPLMMAALIRQESAFKADIRSHAGAVGLMQVMPPTGRELAGRHGPAGFHERNLESPEINLHLGAAFFRDMSRRYDEDLPLVLSAYNAGPTRATRWRSYAEVSDPLRFTERIPFEETRGYVKAVRRNLALYRALYGAEVEPAGVADGA